MAKYIEMLANIAIGLSAIAVAGAADSRSLRNDGSPATEVIAQVKPSFIDSWPEVARDGITFGSTDAKVRILEFVDFECPSCARWNSAVLRPVLDEHPHHLSLTLIHSPIPRHRFAMQSAIAVECAAAQGRAAEFVDAVFAKQDSIGLKLWSEFALEARIDDTVTFAECMASPVPERIAAGQRWAQRLRIGATPTVIISGWMLARPPDATELSRIVRTIMDGKKPF
jgi:protein-disulfide isomerase